MNKKFSTLVAALLVSGVSYAVVSQFEAPALTESPVAMAASANLNGGLRANTLEETLAPAYGFKAGDLANAGFAADFPYWVVEGTTLNLYNKEKTAFVTADGQLSNDVAATKGVVTFDNSNTKAVKVGSNFLVIDNSTASPVLSSVSALANLTKDQKLVGAYAIADKALASGAAAAANYVLAEIPTADIQTAVKMVVTPAASAYAFAKESGNSSLPSSGGTFTWNIITSNNGKHLRSGADGYYLKNNGDGTVGFVEKVSEASVVTLSSEFLLLDGDRIEVSSTSNDLVLAEGDGTASQTAVKPYSGAGQSGVVTDLNGSTIVIATGATNSNVSYVGFNAVPATVTLANGNLDCNLANISAEFAIGGASGNNITFANGGVTYYLGAANENDGTELLLNASSALASATFKGITGGVFQSNASVAIVLRAGKIVYQVTPQTGDQPLYIWKVDAAKGTVVLHTSAIANSEKYILSTSNTEAPTSLSAGNQYVGYSPAKNISLEETNYYFKNEAGSYLGLSADGKSFATVTSVEADPDQSLDGLWTVKANKNKNGVVTNYSFTYRKTSKPLAVKLTFDKTTKEWVAAYDADGSYDQFTIDALGHLCFDVDTTITYKDVAYPCKQQFALNFDQITGWTIDAHNTATSEKFNYVKVGDIIVTGEGAAEQVDWLNVKAGNGNGFGVAYVVGDKKAALEDNVLTNGQVTAVQGPDLRLLGGAQENLNDRVFLRISGSYAYKTPTKKEEAEQQLKDFRASSFVVVDTALYSALIADQENYYYLAEAKGSDMISDKGYHAGQATSYDELTRTKKQETTLLPANFVGLTRRLENAVFEIHHPKGSTISDPVYIMASSVMMPIDKYNEKGLINAGLVNNTDGYVSAAPLYVAIKNYDKKYYVGAAASASNLFITKNNDVDFNDVHGIVNIISRNYKTDGQVYANSDNYGEVGRILAKYVSLDKPEGQFLVTGGTYNKYGEIQPFTFTNRESGRSNILLNDDYSLSEISLKKTDKENIYSVVGKTDTIEIKSASTANEYVGYKHYTQNELENTSYVLKVVSKAGGVNDLYITEDHNKDHSLGMDADTLNSANFKLIKFEAAKSDKKMYGDTIYVSGVEAPYSYINKDKEYAEENDRVVAFTYAIYNADNNEFLAVKQQGSTLENYYYCNPDLKNTGDNAAKAQRFIIKEKADGTVQLLPVYHMVGNDKTIFEQEDPASFNEAYSKLYAGLSDNKIHHEGSIYKITDNDLFRVVSIGAPKYRTVDAAPFDTVRIYKEGMDKVALFAETAKSEIVSGGHFLGMTHSAEKDLKKTMFSFFVDTAYVNRADNYKPQYMLVLDADTLHGFTQCPIPSHGMEDNGRIDTVTGKFLTTMVDSIPAWGKNHSNPYWWEKEEYPRLGFVNAKHIGDDLIVLRNNGIQTKADTIKLDNNSDKTGVFAFRYVDQATKSFLMETKGGWVKWLNGVPVVVSKIEEAEVFNFQPTTNNPTSNDQIGTSEVSIIAGAGSVIVKGAAAKTVTISNILGQTIVSTVLTSDNATISVPAGIVVVAVEGEEAVKTVVR